jgi:ornithine cyclodeaminase/alanine dehydrogenase-like protein (mu-crystallin family)
MDGNYLTVIRTGAVGALAARCLARKESRKAAIVGAGAQGAIQLAALRAVLPIQEVRCYDRDRGASEAFTKSAAAAGLQATAAHSPEEAIEGVDVIVTATPSFQPIIKAEWITPGRTSAPLSDTRGNRKSRPNRRAPKVVWTTGRPAKLANASTPSARADREVHAELGEILTGPPGRKPQEITIFDATGIALQDLAVAGGAYASAMEQGAG